MNTVSFVFTHRKGKEEPYTAQCIKIIITSFLNLSTFINSCLTVVFNAYSNRLRLAKVEGQFFNLNQA